MVGQIVAKKQRRKETDSETARFFYKNQDKGKRGPNQPSVCYVRDKQHGGV